MGRQPPEERAEPPGQLKKFCPHSPAMVRQAARRNRVGIENGQIELRCLRVERVGEPGAPFDRIYSSNVAQFWMDRVQVFRDLRSLLAPGGRVASTYLPRHAGATDDDALRFGEAMLDDMRLAGFVDPHLERGPRVPILTVCAVGDVPPAHREG